MVLRPGKAPRCSVGDEVKGDESRDVEGENTKRLPYAGASSIFSNVFIHASDRMTEVDSAGGDTRIRCRCAIPWNIWVIVDSKDPMRSSPRNLKVVMFGSALTM